MQVYMYIVISKPSYKIISEAYLWGRQKSLNGLMLNDKQCMYSSYGNK